jgi:uncharacterized protein YlzI (FlbEa/FlbD family)
MATLIHLTKPSGERFLLNAARIKMIEEVAEGSKIIMIGDDKITVTEPACVIKDMMA